MPDDTPAPRSTETSAPSPLNFFTVSGVPPTRGSPESDSRVIAIRIRFSHLSLCHVRMIVSENRLPAFRDRASVRRKSGEREDQEAEHEGHHARRLRAADQAGHYADNRDDEDRQRREPVTHHA